MMVSSTAVKTDKKDARGIAQLMRLGWFRPAHRKSASAQEVRALLTARRLLQGKLHDVEMSIRGVLRGFGLKVGVDDPERFRSSRASVRTSASRRGSISPARPTTPAASQRSATPASGRCFTRRRTSS
jgi:transposase